MTQERSWYDFATGAFERAEAARQAMVDAIYQTTVESTKSLVRTGAAGVTEALAVKEQAVEYLTTPTSGTFPAFTYAVQHQLDRALAGIPLDSFADTGHGDMLLRSTNGAAALYKVAYWQAVGARVLIGRGDRDGARKLVEHATSMLGDANKLAQQLVQAHASWLPLTAVTMGNIQPRARILRAGIPTVAAFWRLRSLGLSDEADALIAANKAAVTALQVRLGIGLGVATVGIAAVGYYRDRKQPRPNPAKKALTRAQRDRRLRGLVLMGAGGVLMSPADEAVVAALTMGLGVPLLPVQGTASLVGGALLAGTGAYLAATPRRAED